MVLDGVLNPGLFGACTLGGKTEELQTRFSVLANNFSEYFNVLRSQASHGNSCW